MSSLKKHLVHHLKQLRLPAIASSFEQSARMAEKENLGYEKFLLHLVQTESEGRTNKRVARYLKESRLPLEKSFSVFDMKRLSVKSSRRVKSLLEGDFIANKENLLIFGNPGSGKTHLICAIAQELIHKGYRVRFTSTELLVQELLIAKRNLELAKVLKRLAKFDALILDDIGYVQQTREEMEVLFTLLAERYERGSIMITSNLPFSKWDLIFKDPMTAAAAIDRLVHHSVILELNLKSYRLEAAKRQNKETSP